MELETIKPMFPCFTFVHQPESKVKASSPSIYLKRLFHFSRIPSAVLLLLLNSQTWATIKKNATALQNI